MILVHSVTEVRFPVKGELIWAKFGLCLQKHKQLTLNLPGRPSRGCRVSGGKRPIRASCSALRLCSQRPSLFMIDNYPLSCYLHRFISCSAKWVTHLTLGDTVTQKNASQLPDWLLWLMVEVCTWVVTIITDIQLNLVGYGDYFTSNFILCKIEWRCQPGCGCLAFVSQSKSFPTQLFSLLWLQGPLFTF